jgi:signal transduction histidine kinase
VPPQSASRLAAEPSSELAQQIVSLKRLASAGAEGLVVFDPQGCCVFLNDLAAMLSGDVVVEPCDLSASIYLFRVLQHNRLIDDAKVALEHVQDLAGLACSARRLYVTPSDGNIYFAEHEQRYMLAPYPLYGESEELLGYALFIRAVPFKTHDELLENGLLSSVSHDLRTPLMVIKAAVTGLLQEGLQWDEALLRETLQDINEETDRLTTLVSALLEMSLIQGGALRLQTEWCDLAEIIHTVLDRMQKVTGRHQILYDVAAPLPLIQGDFMQLDRVLSNLIENAVKYSPEGSEIRVTASLAETEVQVAVSDQGYGVPPEDRERIFEKFYRVRQWRPYPPRASDSKHGLMGQAPPALVGGSGLGLAICRGIVQAHHGRIWVEPRAEGGSRFVFTLPVEQSAPMTGSLAHESGPFGTLGKQQAMPEQAGLQDEAGVEGRGTK